MPTIIALVYLGFRALAWYFRVCFQVGFALGGFAVGLFRKKPVIPLVDPTCGDANSVKNPFRD